jgi:hypothetical protein
MSLREAELSTTSGAMSRMTSRATCRGTRMRGVGEVVDDEPARGGVRRRACAMQTSRRRAARGGVVDNKRRDELHDKPRDVPRQPDTRTEAKWSTMRLREAE